MIIDPIGSYLGGKVDGHRDNEVRSVLAPLGKLAEQYGVAVVVVAHRPKATGTRADDLVIGSRAFTALARVVWHLSCDPRNPERRLLLAGKNNLARKGCGLAFTIHGEGAEAAIAWEDQPVSMTADEGLAAANGEPGCRGPEPMKRDAAVEWLKMLLAGGPMAVKDVQCEAEKAGFRGQWRTIQRAREELGVQVETPGFGRPYTWRLPPVSKGDSKGDKFPSNSNNLSTCQPGEIQGKNDDKTRFPREDDKLIFLRGNLSTLAPQDTNVHFPEDDRDYAAGNPDEACEQEFATISRPPAGWCFG